jgi:hypothetical protein
VDVKELLENPRTAAFSRIKYLQSRGSEDEMAEFLNALFLEAFKAKYSGDLDAFIEWMEGWEDVALTGQFNTMESPDVEIPWATLSIPLSSAKVALVSGMASMSKGKSLLVAGTPRTAGYRATCGRRTFGSSTMATTTDRPIRTSTASIPSTGSRKWSRRAK